MDVNEKIVKEWLQVCRNEFTMEDIKFKVFGEKGGSNYSNIDLLSWDGKRYFDYEVKWRSQYIIPNTDNGIKEVEGWINQIKNVPRDEKINEITNGMGSLHRIVVTETTFTKGLRERVGEIFNKAGIEMLFFADIVRELVDKTETKGKIDTEISQIIRMMKFSGILSD